MINTFDFKSHPFTSRLRKVKSAGTNKWIASCPCTGSHNHGDKSQSLSVAYDPTQGKILVYCHKGCSAEDIVSAVGCSLSDLSTHKDNNIINFAIWYGKQNSLRFSEVYQYSYPPFNDGLYKVRYYNADGEKTFRWIHTDPTTKSGFKLRREGFPHRLYVAGDYADNTVILCEGEKDCNTVYRLTGITAVSAENGATTGKTGKWEETYNNQLTFKTVYVFFDNDAAGINFAQIIEKQLMGHATITKFMDIRTVWPGGDCPEKSDITDLVEAVGDDNKAIALISQMMEEALPNAPKPILKSVPNSDVENGKREGKRAGICNNDAPDGMTINQAVEQLQPVKSDRNEVPALETFDAEYFNNTEIPEPVPIIEKILYPGLGLLGSPAKMGKSYLMLQLAVSVATGEKFLGFEVKRPGPVLYLDLQGTRARTKARLTSMGYDSMPNGLTLAYRARTTDNGFIEQIEQWILSSKEKPSLIIVDMLEQVKGTQRRTEDAYRSDNRILEPLHSIALKYDLSVFCVMHTRKGNSKFKPDDPFNEIIGSVAQFGTADCAWMILGKRDEDKKQLSVICRDYDEGQCDFEAIFRNHKWSVSGSIEEIEEIKATAEFNRSPVVFTIRALIKESGGGWSGTMRDLLNEVINHTSEYPASTPEKLRYLVKTVEYRLSCEGIEIEYPNPHGGVKGRRYRFFKRQPAEQTTISES